MKNKTAAPAGREGEEPTLGLPRSWSGHTDVAAGRREAALLSSNRKQIPLLLQAHHMGEGGEFQFNPLGPTQRTGCSKLAAFLESKK